MSFGVTERGLNWLLCVCVNMCVDMRVDMCLQISPNVYEHLCVAITVYTDPKVSRCLSIFELLHFLVPLDDRRLTLGLPICNDRRVFVDKHYAGIVSIPS